MCCLEASWTSDLAAKITALAEIILLDTSPRAKTWDREGSRRRMMANNMKTGGHSSILRLVQYLHVFRDGRGISMVIRSDRWEGLEAIADLEASI